MKIIIKDGIKDKLEEFAAVVTKHGVNLYYVGGCVRDSIIGKKSEDIDVCIEGNVSDIHDLLNASFHSVKLTSNRFPVYIVNFEDFKIEFAAARKETKTGNSRKDFQCSTNATIYDDLYRRDFTINAIAVGVLDGKIIDPHGGFEDLKQSTLRHVSESFAEDPLRVYRAARFSSMGYHVHDSLYEICRSMTPYGISNERVGMELKKCLKNSLFPSRFFTTLHKFGWLWYHFHELLACVGVPQYHKHHPEGDVFTHTMFCVDEAKDEFIRCAMLCHDLGKVTTTKLNNDGKITSIGHETAGVVPTRSMLTRIVYDSKKYIDKVCCLVEMHMIRNSYNSTKHHTRVVRNALRKLMECGVDYNDLAEVVRCDISGRPPLPKYDSVNIGQKEAEHLITSGSMVPIVTGKLLIKMGYEPCGGFDTILKRALKLQDRGTLNKTNWEIILKKELNALKNENVRKKLQGSAGDVVVN